MHKGTAGWLWNSPRGSILKIKIELKRKIITMKMQMQSMNIVRDTTRNNSGNEGLRGIHITSYHPTSRG